MRLFFALELPERLRTDLQRSMESLRQKYPRQKWAHPEGLHITLKFLGACPAPLADGIIETLTPLLRQRPACAIDDGGYGFFPNKRKPRVFHVRIHSDENLQSCVTLLNSSLEALGFEGETRAYRPHITLLRIREAPPELMRDLQAMQLPEIHFKATQVSLMRSFLEPAGARYQCLHAFKLER